MTGTTDVTPTKHIATRLLSAAVVVLTGLAVTLLPAATSSSADPGSVEGLTSAEFAELYDLEPLYPPFATTGCDRLVGTPEVGYCIDSIQTDDWTREHIAAQLMGYLDNGALHDYATAQVQLKQAAAEDPEDPELIELGRRVLDLQATMTHVTGNG